MGGQRRVGGGHRRSPAAEKKTHFLKFKIMKLCGGFNFLLKRLELMLNEFFDDRFSESPFFRVFRGLYIYTKISGIFSDDFYDKKIDFTIKNRFFTKSQFPEIATCRPCDRE